MMKTMAIVMTGTCLLLACGGGSEEAKEPTAPVTDTTMTTEPAPAAPAEPAAVEPAPAPAPAPEPAPAPVTASAELKSIPGDAPVGTLSFEKQNDQILISGQFTGLKKGEHAMYIYEK